MIMIDDDVDYTIDRDYQATIRAKWTLDGSKTLKEAVSKLRDLADELEEMEQAGVVVLNEVSDDYGTLATNNKKVAERYGFYPAIVDEEFESFDAE